MTNVTKKLRHLTEDEKSGIKRAFEVFDTNKDGFLDYHETKAAIRALGFEIRKSQVLAIMLAYDKVEGNKIGFEDFYYISMSLNFLHYCKNPCQDIRTLFQTLVADKIAKRDPLDELKYAYKLFCGDSASDKITLEDLQRINKTLGSQLTEDEMNSMIEEFDLDQDGCSNI